MYDYEVEQEELYYIHLINDECGYLNFNKDHNEFGADSKLELSPYRTKFTMDEIKEINPNYVPFAEKVED